MSEQNVEVPQPPVEVKWYSPLHPAIAIRYERDDEQSPWRITGLIVSSRTEGLGSAWMKSFPWRQFGSPYTTNGIFWGGTPTIDVLDEVYDDTGNLKRQSRDVFRPGYRTQIDPITDGRLLHESGSGAEPVIRTDWIDLYVRLKAEGADEAEVEEARKDYFYQRVAEKYREASAATGKPVEAVAKEFSAPRTSAANWIREARARGYLPPTTKGRAT